MLWDPNLEIRLVGGHVQKKEKNQFNSKLSYGIACFKKFLLRTATFEKNVTKSECIIKRYGNITVI